MTNKDLVPRSGRRRAALFRDEAVAARRNRWLGTVVLDTHPWQRWFTLAAAAVIAAIPALLYFGEFTRTAHVGGRLVPAGGLVRVYAPQAGVVAALHVGEGSTVAMGERLATLSAELNSASMGATQAEIARQIQIRRELLIAQRDRHARLAEQQQRSLDERLAALRSEQAQMDREIGLLASRAELAAKTETRHLGLRKDGFISDQQFQHAQEGRIEQAAKLAALKRERMVSVRDRLALEAELRELPLKAQAEASALEREIATLDQELAAAESRRELVVTAPANGTVTAILAEPGGQAGAARPLLSIVPTGSRLEAHLFAPSRAVGFVKPGQQVLLRYQAYPHQKFGHYEGEVVSVSRSALNPTELPAPLAPPAAGQHGGDEAVYRIIVRPRQQYVTAYGRQAALQPDMQIDAEIVLETRKLYEWVLDPLYTLAGRTGR